MARSGHFGALQVVFCQFLVGLKSRNACIFGPLRHYGKASWNLYDFWAFLGVKNDVFGRKWLFFVILGYF